MAAVESLYGKTESRETPGEPDPLEPKYPVNTKVVTEETFPTTPPPPAPPPLPADNRLIPQVPQVDHHPLVPRRNPHRPFE